MRTGARPFVLDHFLAIYSDPVAGISFEHSTDPSITASDDTVIFNLILRDKQGAKVGEAGRVFRRTPEDGATARLSGLRLDRHVQGVGFGSAFHRREAETFAALGINVMSLEAAWQGAAFWPSVGFEPIFREDDAIAAVLDQLRHVLDPQTGEWCKGIGALLLVDLVAEHRISTADADVLECLVRDPQTSFAEIVDYGRDRSWRTDDGRTLWPGRALLAGARYEAEKRL